MWGILTWIGGKELSFLARGGAIATGMRDNIASFFGQYCIRMTGGVGGWEIIPLSGNMASTNRLQILNRVGLVFYRQIRPNCCIAAKP
jgi:hypothetical protein